MCVRDGIRRSAAGVLLAAIAVSGCAHPSSPAGWLPNPSDARTDAFGAWVRLDRGGPEAANPSGELLVAEADSVWILSDGRVMGRPLAGVRRVETWTYAPIGGLGWWTVLGIASCLSHGAWLVISAPVWLLTGIVATSAESRVGREFLVPGDLAGLRARARFPLGWPRGFDRRTLAAKTIKQRGVRDQRLDAWPNGP